MKGSTNQPDSGFKKTRHSHDDNIILLNYHLVRLRQKKTHTNTISSKGANSRRYSQFVIAQSLSKILYGLFTSIMICLFKRPKRWLPFWNCAIKIVIFALPWSDRLTIQPFYNNSSDTCFRLLFFFNSNGKWKVFYILFRKNNYVCNHRFKTLGSCGFFYLLLDRSLF